MKTLREYIANVQKFSSQAQRYLVVTMLLGIGGGVFQLFFNFYILSLGYEEDFLGLLISVPSLMALVVALFAGYISDLIGRKQSFVLGSLISTLAQGGMLLWPTRGMLLLTGALRGVGNSIFGVATAPFLMEHSTESERTHLFSFSSGIATMSSFLGNFVGGSLPLFFSGVLDVRPTSSTAYAWSLGLTLLLNLVALIPLLRLRVEEKTLAQNPLDPFRTLWESRGPMARLLLPSLIISLGAGMLIPFMNVFFRFRYQLPDDVIGNLFGFGSLGMGAAILLAPVLAERWGKPKTVVITQGLSIPFMIVLGFIPSVFLAQVAFLARMALMNLSGPVYNTMVMEEADESSRGVAASLYSMIWSSGRAISPAISGPIQKLYGFDPVFIITIVAYGVSVYMVYRWFVRGSSDSVRTLQPEPVP